MLDGRLDEHAWQHAAMATDFIRSEPREGQPLTERTVVRVLANRDYLYMGAYCCDATPSGMLINELKRDFDSREGDAFGVAIEPGDGSRSTLTFLTNPGSAKRDAQGFDDGRYVNLQRDGVWHVTSAVHGDGWASEIAIPFKTLGLKSQTIGSIRINFKRRIRRRNEEGYWAPVPRRFTVNYVSLAGTLTGLGNISGGTRCSLSRLPRRIYAMRSRGQRVRQRRESTQSSASLPPCPAQRGTRSGRVSEGADPAAAWRRGPSDRWEYTRLL